MKLFASGVVAMACVVGLSAAALASAPYSVRVQVLPKTAPLNAPRRVSAAGHSDNASRLTVYLGSHGCAKLRFAEAARPKSVRLISATVVGAFHKSKLIAGRVIGLRYACAYLTGVAPNFSIQYAAAKQAYRVTPTSAGAGGGS